MLTRSPVAIPTIPFFVRTRSELTPSHYHSARHQGVSVVNCQDATWYFVNKIHWRLVYTHWKAGVKGR
jgi:hypothetical protein